MAWAEDTIAIADGPVDQARAVAQAIGALGGAYDVSEISLALANGDLAVHIEDELDSRGVATRYAGGRPAAAGAAGAAAQGTGLLPRGAGVQATRA